MSHENCVAVAVIGGWLVGTIMAFALGWFGSAGLRRLFLDRHLRMLEETRKNYRDAQANIRKGTRIVEHRPPPPGWVEDMQQKAKKLQEKQENSLFD